MFDSSKLHFFLPFVDVILNAYALFCYDGVHAEHQHKCVETMCYIGVVM